MASCVAEAASEPASPSPFPAPPPGHGIRPLLEPVPWRGLIPPGLASFALHGFFLSLFALVTLSEYQEQIRPQPVDTRAKVEEQTYEVARIHEPKPLAEVKEPQMAEGQSGQPEVKESPLPVSADGEGKFQPIVQPPESAQVQGIDVIYVPTPQAVVDEMLRLANVQKGEVVMDLGCGDGRIPITAAKKYGAWGYGYDSDPLRIKESLANARKQGIQGRVVFEQRDVFKLDLSRADVVTLYLLPSLNAKLIPQLQVMKPGTRIVTHDFEIPGVKPDLRKAMRAKDDFGDISEHLIYLYTLPLQKEDGTPLDPPSNATGKLTVSEDEVLWNMLGIRATLQGQSGLRIDEVKPGGPASAAGVRAGDRLVMLGGFDVYSKRAEAVHLLRLQPVVRSFEVVRGPTKVVAWLNPDTWNP